MMSVASTTPQVGAVQQLPQHRGTKIDRHGVSLDRFEQIAAIVMPPRLRYRQARTVEQGPENLGHRDVEAERSAL
jgi:hypothetical protein